MALLLFDSDVFCKLGIAGLLEAAMTAFGAGTDGAGCLPALQHMLRRGKLRKTFGDTVCDSLVATAEKMAVQLHPSEELLDQLAGVDRIDVGEAQLFATAAEHGVMVVTGDKRALIALARVKDYPDRLAGKIVTMEAVLLALCFRLGDDVVRAAVQPILSKDKMVRVCFSPGNSDVRGALQSCLKATKHDVAPLILWEPSELT